MKKYKLIAIFFIVFVVSLSITSCQEYYTFVNIPLSFSLATTFNNPNPSTQQCLSNNDVYKDLKDQISMRDREIVAIAARNIYDNTGTSGTVKIFFKDVNGNTLIERSITGSMIQYRVIPFVIILTPQERAAVNNALKNDDCFTASLQVLTVTPQNYDFKIAVDVVIGVKYKITS